MKGFLIVLTVLTLGMSLHAQDGELATARDLYASAAYEDALTVLNRLRNADHPAAQSRAIEQYRAFCLLALGRGADAERAIEAVVAAEPGYHPSDSDVSPRVRSAFTDVRRRMLPAIIQQKYVDAKSAFDRKDWSAASGGFHQVLTALADPDVAAEANQSPLADLRTLAVGFEELSAKAAAPPPPPPPAPIPVAAPPSRPAPPRVYTMDDATVVAPVILNQALPLFPGQVVIPRSGRIELVIDESGLVESAMMTMPITTIYDNLALNASKSWRYKPATVDGVPVKFRKTVQIAIRPTKS
jgi:hypothetical protein